MAAHPNKVKWKEFCPHGLSASMFGMALGFKGKVSDFIDYERHIVGTKLEFKGNECTDHGILTEPKSRALYEMLTGSKVYSGGFFLGRDALLGCSPDGRVFMKDAKKLVDGGIRRVNGATSLVSTVPASCYRKDAEEEEKSSVRSRCSTTNSCSLSPVPTCSFPNKKINVEQEHPGQSSPLSFSYSFKIPFSPSRASCSPTLLGIQSRGGEILAPSPSNGLSLCTRTGAKSHEHSPSATDLSSSSGGALRTSGVLNPPPSPCTSSLSPSTGGFHGRSHGSLDVREFSKVLFWRQQESIQKRKRNGIKMRLLEIKSPVHQLYGGQGDSCQPFGIPLAYMCQIQGQMAIADAEECDFFVYVDSTGQVEAWRVFRSPEFWKWAEPKLLNICQWIRDGPPSWMNRSFSFDPFDFSVIRVLPLVFPFSIRECSSLAHPKRFPFFDQFECPYDWLKSGVITSADSEVEAIAKMVQSEIVKHFFQEDKESEDGTKNIYSQGFLSQNRYFYVADVKQFANALYDASVADKTNNCVLCNIQELLWSDSIERGKKSVDALQIQGENVSYSHKLSANNGSKTISSDFVESSTPLIVQTVMTSVEDGRIKMCVYREGKSSEAAIGFLYSHHRSILSLLCTSRTVMS